MVSRTNQTITSVETERPPTPQSTTAWWNLPIPQSTNPDPYDRYKTGDFLIIPGIQKRRSRQLVRRNTRRNQGQLFETPAQRLVRMQEEASIGFSFEEDWEVSERPLKVRKVKNRKTVSWTSDVKDTQSRLALRKESWGKRCLDFFRDLPSEEDELEQIIQEENARMAERAAASSQVAQLEPAPSSSPSCAAKVRFAESVDHIPVHEFPHVQFADEVEYIPLSYLAPEPMLLTFESLNGLFPSCRFRWAKPPPVEYLKALLTERAGAQPVRSAPSNDEPHCEDDLEAELNELTSANTHTNSIDISPRQERLLQVKRTEGFAACEDIEVVESQNRKRRRVSFAVCDEVKVIPVEDVTISDYDHDSLKEQIRRRRRKYV